MASTSWKSDVGSCLCEGFSQEQINFICQCLFQWNDGERLVKLFTMNPQLLNNPYNSSTVLKAYLFALYYKGQFETFFNLMSENRFERSHHSELVQLWYMAKYEEDKNKKLKELVPVDKYRIRKKNPPPKSIWDGDELIYSFRKGDREILKDHYNRNQYPNSEEKREIARKTGLTMTQISNWFKNRRQRAKGETRK
uniref:Homeobox domain-containing protein n=1 Tax=Meloidogyne hapla TaxID=6305 RepID=A0A1I8BBG8_MELHA